MFQRDVNGKKKKSLSTTTRLAHFKSHYRELFIRSLLLLPLLLLLLMPIKLFPSHAIALICQLKCLCAECFVDESNSSLNAKDRQTALGGSKGRK